MANHMADVAKMLGVELGEVFEIKYPHPAPAKTTASFSENGFRIVDTDGYVLTPNRNESILYSLLKGNLTVKRIPWKPKYNEIYFYVYSDGVVADLEWHNSEWDFVNYKLGNCYRTAQEAEANRDKWIAFYASDEILEV